MIIISRANSKSKDVITMSKEYEKYTLKNGEVRYKFDVSLGIVNGKRKRTTVRAKSVKEGRLIVSQLTVGTKQIMDNNSMTFGQAVKLYEQYKIAYVSKATNNNTVAYLKNYKFFDNMRINQITYNDILGIREKFIKEGKKNTTINAIETKLKSMYTWLIKRDIVQKNPFDMIDKLKDDTKEINILSEEEFWMFVEFFEDYNIKLALKTIFYSGLRKSEFCGLSIKDLDVENNQLHLSHTVKQGTNNKIEISITFKNKTSKRSVPIPKWLTTELLYYFKQETEIYPFLKLYAYLNRCIYRTLKNRDFKHISVHDLRHSYASMLIYKGVDIFTVSKILGHSNIVTTTKTYGHLYDKRRKEITNLFEESNNWSQNESKVIKSA